MMFARSDLRVVGPGHLDQSGTFVGYVVSLKIWNLDRSTCHKARDVAFFGRSGVVFAVIRRAGP
jgi:hypothetical protein